jgi:hypothetical protein
MTMQHAEAIPTDWLELAEEMRQLGHQHHRPGPWS